MTSYLINVSAWVGMILVSFLSLGDAFAQGDRAVSSVPEWSRTAVWYQIFPERFCNGDTANDPAPHDMIGSWPYATPIGWHISPWMSDWYKLQPWEAADGHDFYWNAGVRRYGGDIQGIIDHLDYLKDLGITAIYLNPIFESPSLHKYDTRMYHHVDNNFGPDPVGDEKIWAAENPADPATWEWTSADKLFLKLIREVHSRGMRIIIDGVFNHVGTSFWAFEDVLKNQQKSRYADWFEIRRWDDPATPGNEFDYEGWNGVRDLPEISKNGRYDLADGFADHIHSIVKRWMDPNGDGNPSDGIDGWRLDAADKISLKFWRQFRIWIKEINPDAYITGELWWEDWQVNEMFDAAPWLQGDAFDGIMNYRFARAVKKFVTDVKDQISAGAFSDSITVLTGECAEENVQALQNLVDSHDVDRLSSQIVNPDRSYDHYANPGQNSEYLVRKPDGTELLKLKLIVGIQMTMPGAPMIYYGDEVGMWGGDDPDCRKPMVWAGMKYDNEVSDPRGRQRTPDSVFVNTDLLGWYKKLIAVRRNHKELSEGSLSFFYVDNEKKVLGYGRSLEGKTVYILLNNSSSVTPITFRVGGGEVLTDLIDGSQIAPLGGDYRVTLKPYQIMILE
ncbi:MAG: glycoside hydrolase family 13 protein [Bacteroidetes bacterium]|jgi:glycosidase|nr:glycoside hydrolase family 13 protein [Bacteroidota bacterium]MCL5033980.1 glycoside hydrolase family 13 protein [Bacteroidota bacterium]